MKFLELIFNEEIENTPVFAVSIVKEPAIEDNFIKLSKDGKVNVVLADEDKQIIVGPALIPNKWIYRSAESLNGEEGYIKFSAETIEKAAHSFLSYKLNNEVTLEHGDKITSLTLLESWITKSDGEVEELGFNLPKGSWMMSYKVNDLNLWNEIKEGKFNGFSIEGNFLGQLIPGVDFKASSDKDDKDEIDEIVEDIKNSTK